MNAMTNGLSRGKPNLDAFYLSSKNMNRRCCQKAVWEDSIAYCLNQWVKLVAFLEDGRLEIDNNRSERSIKPVVIGRKNWLFSDTPQGAKACAIIYSVVETAIVNGLNPYYYLHYLLKQLDLRDINSLDQLLPWSTTLPVTCIDFKQSTKS